MINAISTNITSPLGLTTEENYLNVREGASALKVLRSWKGIPGQICAGIFSDLHRHKLAISGYTFLESLAIHSIQEALCHTCLDIDSDRVGFILSTTKCNIESIDGTHCCGAYSAPGAAARKIAESIGIRTTPIAVSNACISGVTAQVLACRYISAGLFDTVIICGADTVSRFCVAGFSSFKALSPYPCRPFDIERLGLNIGECASTMILSRDIHKKPLWHIVASHLDNDAYHVSAPAPDGDGVYRAIRGAMDGIPTDCLATVSAHGTATMFNDQMESKAIAKAGLSDIPVSSYKGYFGHTLGAAGVIEPILAMKATEEGVILPAAGFEETGVSGKISISSMEQKTAKQSLLKIISGFGGCNGAILYSMEGDKPTLEGVKAGCTVIDSVTVRPGKYSFAGGEKVQGSNIITSLYKNSTADNPRFYKMDTLSRLVYAAAASLIERSAKERTKPLWLLLFNGSSSIVADRKHIETLSQEDGFYPSPAEFINTLPNVVLGELASRYGIKDETTMLILPGRDDNQIERTIEACAADHHGSLLVTGWVNCDSEDDFEADLKLLNII